MVKRKRKQKQEYTQITKCNKYMLVCFGVVRDANRLAGRRKRINRENANFLIKLVVRFLHMDVLEFSSVGQLFHNLRLGSE